MHGSGRRRDECLRMWVVKRWLFGYPSAIQPLSELPEAAIACVAEPQAVSGSVFANSHCNLRFRHLSLPQAHNTIRFGPIQSSELRPARFMLCDRRPWLIAPMTARWRLTGTPTVLVIPATVGGSPATFAQHASSDRLIDRVSAFLTGVTKSTIDGFVPAP